MLNNMKRTKARARGRRLMKFELKTMSCCRNERVINRNDNANPLLPIRAGPKWALEAAKKFALNDLCVRGRMGVANVRFTQSFS